MNIKISGASGFIGQAVMSYCKAQGLSFTGYTRQKKNENLNINYIPNYEDIPEGGALIHLAEDNVVQIGRESTSAQLVQKLSEKNFEQIVYASSAAVYRPTENLIDTNNKNFSEHPYAQNKLKNEDMILKKNKIVARISNVFGPRMSSANVLTKILQQRNSSKIEVMTLNSSRDFIWIDDVAKILTELALSKQTGLFHVSTGVSTSIQQLIEMICRISKNTDYKISETNPGQSMTKLCLNPELTLKKLKIQSLLSIEKGLEKMILEGQL